MPPRKTWGQGRKLTTAERMVAAIGPNPAQLMRAGLSQKKAEALEREWLAWDRAFGFAWRTLAGIATIQDRERLDVGEEPDDHEPPEPPGLSSLASAVVPPATAGTAARTPIARGRPRRR
jgi:hypothetical protein